MYSGRKSTSGFSIVELTIVLVVVGILMSVGAVFFKGVFDFVVHKRCVSKVEEIKAEFERLIPITSLSYLSNFFSSYKPNLDLEISQFLLKYYPDPCDYSPELLPSFSYPLFLGSEKAKELAYFKYSCGKKRVELPIKLSDLKKDLCQNVAGAQTAITRISFERYITDDAFVGVSFVYPPKHRLKIVSPETVKVVKEGSFEDRLLLKEGINLITFVLSSYGREVYRRNEYVLYTSLAPESFPAYGVSLTRENEFLKLSFERPVEALVVIGDGSFYIPRTNPDRTYAFPLVSSQLWLYTKDAKGAEHLYYKEFEEVPLSADLLADVEELESSYKIKVEVSSSMNLGNNLTCSVFENGQILIEKGDCDNLTLEFDKGVERLITILLRYSKIPLSQCDILEDREGMFVASCN